MLCMFFFFNGTATAEVYTLSLHDALPICGFASIQMINGSEKVVEFENRLVLGKIPVAETVTVRLWTSQPLNRSAPPIVSHGTGTEDVTLPKKISGFYLALYDYQPFFVLAIFLSFAVVLFALLLSRAELVPDKNLVEEMIRRAMESHEKGATAAEIETVARDMEE